MSFRRAGGRLLAAGLIVTLAACSAGSPAEPDASPPAEDSAAPSVSAAPAASPDAASSPGPGVDPEMFALAMLTPEEQQAQLAALSATLERDLWSETGMDDALGGSEAADEAFAALTSALIDEVVGARDAQWFGRFGALIPASDELSFGGVMFGGLLLGLMGPEAAVKVTNNLKPGEKQQSTEQADGAKSFTVGGSVSEATLKAIVDLTKNGVNGKLRVNLDIAPCPDANGVFTAKAVVEASSTIEGGRTGTNLTTEVTVTGRVGDNAELTGYDVTSRIQAAEFKSSKGAFVDLGATMSHEGGKVTGATRQVNRYGGKANQEMAEQWWQMGLVLQILMSGEIVKAAEQGWKSGRCVEVQVTTDPAKRTGLKPSAPVSILATPRSKVDGAPTKGTVTASLGGATSVDPSGTPVPADATFAYVAPGEKDQSATVTLEAKSRRGIGKADVAFDTRASKGYFIGATGGTYKQQGLPTQNASTMATTTPTDICDITVPFELTSPETGGRQVFTPTSPTGGTTSYTMEPPMLPFRESGKGTYTLTLDGDRGTIVTKVRGTATIVGSPEKWKTTATQTFSLEPTEFCP